MYSDQLKIYQSLSILPSKRSGFSWGTVIPLEGNVSHQCKAAIPTHFNAKIAWEATLVFERLDIIKMQHTSDRKGHKKKGRKSSYKSLVGQGGLGTTSPLCTQSVQQVSLSLAFFLSSRCPISSAAVTKQCQFPGPVSSPYQLQLQSSIVRYIQKKGFYGL